MINLDQFVRDYTVRRLSDLVTPRMHPLTQFQFPKGSVFHYWDRDNLEAGPPTDEVMLRKVTKPIYLGHVIAQEKMLGAPRRVSLQIPDIITHFHNRHRRYLRLKNLTNATTDQSTLVMYNYNILNHLYRYQRTSYTMAYEFRNIADTFWKNVAQAAKETGRQQFVVMHNPTYLPRPSDLKSYQSMGDHPSQAMTKVFNTFERLNVMEFYRWLGMSRDVSVMANVPTDQLSKVNIVVIESGHYIVLNLGLLDSWRVVGADEAEERILAQLDDKEAVDEKALRRMVSRETSKRGLRPVQFQLAYLHTLMQTMQLRRVQHVETQERDETDPRKDQVLLNDQETQKKNALAGAEAKRTAEPVPAPEAVAKKATPEQDPSQDSPSVPTDGSSVIAPEYGQTPASEIGIKDEHLKELDKTQVLSDHIERTIEANIAQLDKQVDTTDTNTVNHGQDHAATEIPFPDVLPLDKSFNKLLDRYAASGTMTAPAYLAYQKAATTYKTLPSPDDPEKTLEQVMVVTDDMHAIKDHPEIVDVKAVVDKTMLKSTLLEFDKRYIRELMHKDVTRMALNVQHAGYAVTDFRMEQIEDVSGGFKLYSMKLNPIEGAPTTVQWRLPILDDEGVYRFNDVKYNMRKQRGELPIWKVGINRVAITSYYGKIFVERSEKKINDYGAWIRNQIYVKGMDDADTSITQLNPSNVFDHLFNAPRIYTILSQGFRSMGVTPVVVPEGFEADSYNLNFDHKKRVELFGEDKVKMYETNGNVVIGQGVKGTTLLIDQDGFFSLGKDGEVKPGWSTEEFFGLDASKAPVDYVVMTLQGRLVPLGVILAYEMGLSTLVKYLNATVRKVEVGTRVNLQESEFALVFNNETWAISKQDPVTTMLLAGFREYHRVIRDYDSHLFDKRGVYLHLMDVGAYGVRSLREVDLMYQMFVDPITLTLLKKLREPENFRDLLLKATRMLAVDTFPVMKNRDKGYERMAGAVYSEIVKAIRSHNGRPGKSRHPIELHPHAVWKNITTDASNAIVSDINPIQNLKEAEALTFSGTGGRSGRTMVKETRVFQEGDLGVVSESTVDSGSVGVNVYLSANPRYNSLYGLSDDYNFDRDGATSMLSTSALLAPGSNHDDAKRVNFVGIQNAHVVACNGYRQMPIRTGYESVIAHRTGDMFATTARMNGKVLSVSNTGIVVQYEDGTKKGVELGRRFGDAAGLTIPHDLKTELVAGQDVKKGDVIAYNQGFFERDILDPKSLVYKSGIMVKVALMEAPITFEDSCALSKRVAEMLTTKVTKPKEIVVRFDQEIRRIVDEGTSVDAEDILCYIEDPTTASAGLFSESSLDTLKALKAHAPAAKVNGTVDRIEVFYNGDPEDMSDSLRAIALAADKRQMRRLRSAGKTPHDGSVTDNFRVGGNPLMLNTAVIRFQLTSMVPAGVGDKGVFCNQMKTVFGEVMEYDIVTESGEVIDAKFSQNSVDARVVRSPPIIGTTNTLLMVIGKNAAKIYRS